MIKRFLPITLVLFFAFSLKAQTPTGITYDGKLEAPQLAAPKLMCNEAGTITFGTYTGQSNDTDIDTIYMCFGDEMEILHNGDEDLSGDPIPGTPAGIGYGFYSCPPTIDGMDLPTILTDPCIAVDGAGNPAPGGMFIAIGDDTSGDITFQNDGSLQGFFNNGDPVLLWFAPITYDERNPPNANYENGGPCVDVNTEVAFAVVYLNEIAISNIDPNTNATGCGGSFLVEGGLSEFDGSAYDIDITLSTDPTVVVPITQTPNHGDVINFSVPQPGVYDIVVTDDKGCSSTAQIDMSNCTSVTFNMPDVSAGPGATVCLDVTVQDFTNVGSLQLTINWDPNILSYNTVQGFNPDMSGLGAGNFNPDQANGNLILSWLDLSFNGVTLPDDAVIFQLCFDVTGDLAEMSDVGFSNAEVGDPNTVPYGFVGIDGSVTVNNVLSMMIEQDSVSCFGLSDGSFTVTAFGGSEPYSFTWNEVPAGPNNGPEVIAASGESFTVADLPAGVYEINLSDSNVPATTITQTIEVLQGPFTGVSLVVDRPDCFGDMNGSITAEVDIDGVIVPNPDADFTFTWNNSPDDAATINNLGAGFYAVTVTDMANCEWLASTSLSQPPELMLDETIIDASCSGASNGEISVVASGGTTASGDYTFEWQDMGQVVAATSTIANLLPGDYGLIVTDDNGCEAADVFTVGAIKTLSINAITTDISCNGFCDGEINVTGTTTGAPADEPYTFTWSNTPNAPMNTATTSTVDALCAGTYFLTMEDADPAGCLVIDSFVIEEPAELIVTLAEASNETCVVGMDGSATVAVTGGTFPFEYSWSHDNTELDSIADNLVADLYTVEVTDINDCLASLEIEILAPTPPNITLLEDDNLDCAEDTDGTLTVTAEPGGAAIGGYMWSNGGVGETIVGLSPGTYTVTVTAEDGCTAIDSAMVLAPPALALDSIVAQSPSCPGDGNGTLTVFASGGTEPYLYIWENQPEDDTLTFNLRPGLSAGTYIVTVVDANGCPPRVSTAEVVDPPSIEVSFSAIDDVSCFSGVCDGGATATAMYSDGTTGTFNFIWESGEFDNGQMSSAAAQLCSGLQGVTVTDVDMCFGVDSVDVPSPPEIIVDLNIDPVSCNGESDGSITLSVSGGTPDYDYLWVETGDMTPTTNDLPAGIYNAVITDDNGCIKSQIVELGEPDPLILSIDPANTADVTCNGDSDGTIGLTWNTNDNINAIGPNPFTWSDNVAPPTASIATDLPAGTYAATITDVKGCTDSVSYTIAEPTPITAVIPDPEEPNCFGESTFIIIEDISGGNGQTLLDYSYMVDNNGLNLPPDQPFSVFAGPHTVTIEDPLGCTFEVELNINQPSPITISIPATIEIELGDSTTRLNPIVSASLPVDSFVWSPGTYLSDPMVQSPFVIEPLEDTEYTFTVIDENGCTATAQVLIEIDKNRNVYIPNVFSPNGDGFNDEFRIFACTGVEDINFVRIYDRWGELIYEDDDLPPDCIGGSQLWDGRFNGKTMNPAVFVYIIEVEFIDGVTLLYRGDLTLLR